MPIIYLTARTNSIPLKEDSIAETVQCIITGEKLYREDYMNDG